MEKTRENVIYNGNAKFLLKKVWQYNKKIYFLFFAFTIFTAIQPFVGILTPKFLIEELLDGERIEILLYIVLASTLFNSIIDFGISWIKGLRLPEFMKVRYKMVEDIYSKILSMKYVYTEDKDKLNKLNLALKAVNSDNVGIEAIYLTAFGLMGSVLTLLGYSSIIATLHPVILIYLVFNVVVVYRVSYSAKKFAHDKEDDLTQTYRKSAYIFNVASDFLYGKDIRVFSLKKWLLEKLAVANSKSEDINRQILNRYEKVNIMDGILLFFREGIIYFYIIWLVINGNLDIGNFIMYFATISGFAALMQKIITDCAFIHGQNIYVVDYRTFMEEVEEEENTGITLDKNTAGYKIEFREVSFCYPNSNQWILRNFNLEIYPGEKVALVGLNGAGKTTVIKLLTGLYKPTRGEILINGKNINLFSKNEYYELFSVAFQEIKLMAFSIADNIAGSEERNMKSIVEALRAVDIEKKVNSFAKGIDTVLYKYFDESGVELSGGEKQKLVLARAIYKNAPIIIMDEPTASLDPLAEYEVYNNLNKISEGKTAIYISHRLSSTKFCDKIVFLENGTVAECGNHLELMKLGGKYKSLFELQAEYYSNT